MRSTRRVELETGILTVEVRSAAFPLEDLCGFAARHNTRRGFLFLSKVLGKHWPAAPSAMRRVHEYLAARLNLGQGPALFIALAETATGLGQGVFEAALDLGLAEPALFLHSTRYRVPGRECLNFEESHCHAPDQYLHEPLAARHQAVFRDARELVLIDDEISTGSTLCHLAAAYRAHNPKLERVHFVAITDFSGEQGDARFSARLGLPVHRVTALEGAFSFAASSLENSEPAPPAVGLTHHGQMADGLGRFGLDQRLPLPALHPFIAGLEPGAKVLVLGTGEFMHPAFRLGLALEHLGFEVAIQATTRSPILPGADIARRLVFPDNYGEGINNYLYNVAPDEYARIIVCHETGPEGLSDLLGQLGPACMAYRYA